jgi:hypothetical protein
VHDKFDISDVEDSGDPVDNLRSILQLSHEVLMSYGATGPMRIQRLARWVVENLSVAGSGMRVEFGDDEEPGFLGVYVQEAHLEPEEAREVAAMILDAADYAEEERMQ